MIPDTTHVREVSRVEHPSAWRADWQRRWDDAKSSRTSDARLYYECELLLEYLREVAAGQDRGELIAAARYAVGE